MVALLRLSRFMSPDKYNFVLLELRQLQDTKALVTSRHTKQFCVTKRFTDFPNEIANNWFDTKKAARQFWSEEAVKMEDAGMQRYDFTIHGFHEDD